jgi:hypothetical protein
LGELCGTAGQVFNITIEEKMMTDGKMPSGDMVEIDRRQTPENVPSTAVMEALLDALKQLNPDQLKILYQKLQELTPKDQTSTPQSTDNSSGGSVAEVGVQNIGDVANRGIETASRVQDLGFVEFTAGLINGTFDAIVGATLKQMQGYSQLVADLAKTVSQFQAENVSDAQINQYLAERYPDGEGTTVVRSNYTFVDTPEDTAAGISAKKASEKLNAIATNLNLATKDLPEGQRLKLTESGTASAFNAAQVTQIRQAVGALLATSQLSILRTMAREGMARIVIDDGEILTRLTFNITTTESQAKQKSNYNQNINQTTIGGSAGWAWWKVSASTTNTNINVNTVNESSFDSTTMNTEIIGQVKIRFRTETFTSVDVPQTPEETKNS